MKPTSVAWEIQINYIFEDSIKVKFDIKFHFFNVLVCVIWGKNEFSMEYNWCDASFLPLHKITIETKQQPLHGRAPGLWSLR